MFPFDRLIRTVDELVKAAAITDSVFAQIGNGTYEPTAMPFCRFLDKAAFDARLLEARAVISHAGIGTIATTLKHGKPMLVLPRLQRYGEHVNDHQVATARKYGELGHVVVAPQAEDIADCLLQLSIFVPVARNVNAVGVAERIARFLASGN